MAIEELQGGRYHYLRLLGSGGMGEVYLMQDTRVNRQVAIKVLRAEASLYPGDEKTSSSARLFEREARAIAALDHPNILPLYDFGEEAAGEGMSMTYMVMPYCVEGSLETWLRQRGGELLTPHQVAALIEQAAEGLQYAHEHKVIHLDVKPPNFLLRSNRKDPTKPTLLLADFGIARNFTTVSSSSRTIRGTPAAMSPEQWSGEPVFASDQYALAVMAYEMLAGRPPFVGSMEQLMYRHFSVEPPAPSSFNQRLSAAIDSVLRRALAKKPEERYPSIIDFANALSEAANQPDAYSAEDLTRYATLALTPSEAEVGISRMLTLESGEEVTVSVPPGAQDGQVLRFPRADAPGESAGLVVVNIAIQTSEIGAADISEESVETFVGTDLATPTPAASAKSQDASAGAAPITPRLIGKEPGASMGANPAPQLRLASLASETPVSVSRAPNGHNQPTIAGMERSPEITMAPTPVAQPRSRVGMLAIISLLVLIAGSLLYVYASHQIAAANTQLTPTHAGPTPTLAPTATPTPTVAPGEYIAGTYNGSMANNDGSQYTPISVYLVQTNGSGALTGSVTFNSTNVYTLKGVVDLKGNFSFTVQQPGGQLPLVFMGALQSGNYLRGNFCHSATSPCLSLTGYFTVGPRT